MQRQPPALALWLLRRLGPSYCKEALEGDLFEQYQQDGSPSWYWRQTLAAVMIAAIRRALTCLVRVAAMTSLRLLTETAMLVGALVLAQRYRQICASPVLPDPFALAAVVATIALVASFGFYLSLRLGKYRRASCGAYREPYRGILAAFILTALSAGTLTWASTRGEPRCGGQSCACLGASNALPGTSQ